MKNTTIASIVKNTFSVLTVSSALLLGCLPAVSANEQLPDSTAERGGINHRLAPAGGSALADKVAIEQKININLASFEQLLALPGIGKVKATAIINYRKETGMFKVLEDLQNIKGIGAKIFARLQHKIKI